MQAQWRLLLATTWMLMSLTVAHQVRALFSVKILWFLAGSAIFCFLLLFFKKFKFTRLPLLLVGIACLTVAYTQARAWQRLHEVINPNWIGQVFTVQGTIVSIPTSTLFGVRFLFKPSPQQSDAQLQAAVDVGSMPSQISVAWYNNSLPSSDADALQVGQVWSLPLGLKPMHSTQNPGVFDQEQYWFARNVRGLATVRLNKKTPLDVRPQLLRTDITFWSVLQNMRAHALQRIESDLSGESEDATALLKALTFGDRSAISNFQWNLFQKTGVTHLVSISGVHITMLAMLIGWLTRRLWQFSPKLCAWMPSLYAAQWLGLLVALTYALLAGWGLPAQRTVVMLAMWLFLSRLGVASSGVRVLCFALWGVLIFDPFAVLTIGFWLSFGAVAWLILALGSESFSSENETKKTSKHKWLSFIGVQLGIGLALLPATLFFFHQASLLGVVVNFVAIPLVGGLVMPLLLFACVLSFSFGWVWPLVLAHAMLAKCLKALASLSMMFPQGVWVYTLSWWKVLGLVVVSIALMIFIRRLRWRRSCLLAVVALLIFVIPRKNIPIEEGQVRVHVIDIGQGTSVLLQTAHHNWLYDTGPKYGKDADAGERVIVPYLRELGVDHLDGMVLSHNDSDHTGGAVSVSQYMNVAQVYSSIPSEHIVDMGVKSPVIEFCVAGQAWRVDGVDFSFLNPNEAMLHDAKLANNPKSCVLRIEAKQGELKSLLLTGDIDGQQEVKLVVEPTGSVRNWHTDVVMMPHHGSSHSSTEPFIEATSPRWAIAQAGYLNRYKHPSPMVWARYQEAGARVFSTIDTGALQFCLGCTTSYLSEWRDGGRRYWWD